MDSKLELEALYQPIIALVLVALSALLVYKGIAVPEWLVGLAILAVSAVFHQQALSTVIKSGVGQLDPSALAEALAPLMAAHVATAQAQQAQPAQTAQPELTSSPSRASQ